MAIGLIINHIFTKYYKITIQNYITIQRDKVDLLFRKATKTFKQIDSLDSYF
jgi:hypothetical protein